ncbi:MED14-domain-containing protein [Fistulina hepatica ATCC 64428]|uniref:Mediator of RNA polymerase II transcription subunit 14 n=1 Tax=Fistulina hepatica ATCC 64428 TaxID=1128425 RepID=A0A0D7AQK7_9AGAR|nr:MED14-domain-containing protein [Fistulina hepatica ATCC 64428]
MNGLHDDDTSEFTIQQLEAELPVVHDGQVPLGELVSRVAQAIYAELQELAETMPNMSDAARKRTMADWVVKTKKQVVKLYAVAKWSRDADTVQKCMNITAFLMNQNRQFDDVVQALGFSRENLNPARLRNHDLLTSLDVLTTGTYWRLPTSIRKWIIPEPPLTNQDIVKTFLAVEEAMRFRLRMFEVIPVEISAYHIAGGRVHFTDSKLFTTSLTLSGIRKEDRWMFVDVEFLFKVGGDTTGMQDLPTRPLTMMDFIAQEVDARLSYYLPRPPIELPAGVELPPEPKLADNTVDAPLVRLYNFLQIMSLSYQLEILLYQASRMRSLGWADYLSLSRSTDGKSFTASYWVRKPPPQAAGRSRSNLPLFGGTLSISIGRRRFKGGPARGPKGRVLADLQQKSKLHGRKSSDEVESLAFEVVWEPAKDAIGVTLPPTALMPEEMLRIDSQNLDFESLLRGIIRWHSREILSVHKQHLSSGAFAEPGVVVQINNVQALRVNICGDEIVIVGLDARTGRLTLKDSGDLAAAGRNVRFAHYLDQLNENPMKLFDLMTHLRFATFTNGVVTKANSLGLQSFRHRNFQPSELQKLGGPAMRGTVYIQLAKFPMNYLVVVTTEARFQYALITAKVLPDSMYAQMIMEDIGWLDFERIHGSDDVSIAQRDQPIGRRNTGFDLDTRVLRELYSYCCARVAYVTVESQFKTRHIPFVHVNPAASLADAAAEFPHIQSSLARSVPALSVDSKAILDGSPAAEAAMPNIRVIPLNWWSEKEAQVVTCVKLKYVQQPMGKRASGTSHVIRPSKRIIYDASQAVVSFLSENVSTCVEEFLEEWARVSKMVVIAREVAGMAKEKNWPDVRLLSFDLQTVEFAYASDYVVSIACEDQLLGGTFHLRFSRLRKDADAMEVDHASFNPHGDAEPFLRNILKHGHGRLASSVYRLVVILRETLPIVEELESIRWDNESANSRLSIDTFTKAAGWFRLLYGDIRHALDFRLMIGKRVAILDGSVSLFHTPASGDASTSTLGLRPIPRFKDILLNVVQEAAASKLIEPGAVVPMDAGLVCNTASVRLLARQIHTKIVHECAGSQP